MSLEGFKTHILNVIEICIKDCQEKNRKKEKSTFEKLKDYALKHEINKENIGKTIIRLENLKNFLLNDGANKIRN